MTDSDKQLHLQAKDILRFHPNAEVTLSKTYEHFGLDTLPSVSRISIAVEVDGKDYNVTGCLVKSVFPNLASEDEKTAGIEHSLTLKILNKIRNQQRD